MIRQVLLRQFDFVVKDRQETKNQVDDHFCRLMDEDLLALGDKAEINNVFPGEQILVLLIISFLGFQTLLLLGKRFCAHGFQNKGTEVDRSNVEVI